VELNMTVADVMDIDQGGTSELVAELKALNTKLDRIESTMDAMTHRIESLEEIREDLS
jgi:prefoldin subunit 5